ncbi:MAG: protein-glutamate O-methyltransferase CheR [Gemmatimonadaceae bacterium]
MPHSGQHVAVDPHEFALVREIVYREAGIRLPDSKKALVEARLGKRLRHHGLQSFTDYLRLVEEPARGSDEVLQLINSMTTNKTSFFREPHHLDYLNQVVFPAAAGRVLRIWSAGCSSGEEPYSIAMMAVAAGVHATILATDIDTNVLARARAGRYDAAQADSVPSDLRARFFRPVSGDGRTLEVVPSIRDMVDVRRVNLNADAWPSGDAFDVIFCRNVVIYFDRQTQRRLFSRLAAALTPDGVLALGHSSR